MTPLLHSMSVWVTVAVPFSFTPPVVLTFTSAPFTVLALLPSIFTTSAAITLPATTWYVRMAVSFGMSFRRASTVPAGSLAKASSVGANTVNGPAPFSVGTSPAAVTAAASVLNEPAATAVSTMSFMCVSVPMGAHRRPPAEWPARTKIA
jgi:hypothetical protein